MKHARDRKAESGVALLAVMLALVVITMLALGLLLATKNETEEAGWELSASERRAWFDAVLLRTAVSLLDASAGGRPRIDGVAQTIDVLGQKIPIVITSEFGKVDLNAADEATLMRLLLATGLGPAEAEAQAEQIMRWRDGDNEARKFRVITELEQLPGMTDALYNSLASSVTVYSGRGRVDQSVAPLLALQSIDGIDRLAAAQIVRDRLRDQGTQNGEIINGRLAAGINITSWPFQIVAELTLGERHEHAEAVIRMTGDPKQPYFILWREETPS